MKTRSTSISSSRERAGGRTRAYAGLPRNPKYGSVRTRLPAASISTVLWPIIVIFIALTLVLWGSLARNARDFGCGLPLRHAIAPKPRWGSGSAHARKTPQLLHFSVTGPDIGCFIS